MDRGAWKAAVHGVTEGQTRLSDFTFTFHFHALEKEMVTHSSVLPVFPLPGRGEPGGLPSMGSHRVGHDWSDLAAWSQAAIIIIMIPIVRTMTLTEQVLYVIIKTFYRYSLIHYENKPSNREKKIEVHEDFIMCPCLHNKFANGTVNIKPGILLSKLEFLEFLNSTRYSYG